MSKQDIWMPIVIGDYLGDTQRLTTEQHGAYFLLLMDYWRNGPPPADDAVLCSITRLKLARFRKHKKTLLEFFTVVDGRLVNKRADLEKTLAIQNANRNSQKARHAAEVRWHGSNDDAPSIAPSNATSNAPECPSPLSSFTNVKAADEPQDIQKLVFDEGVALLVRTGSAGGAARTFIGMCRKAVGDQRFLDLIRECVELNISEPRAWLAASIKSPANDQASGLTAAISAQAKRMAGQGAQ